MLIKNYGLFWKADDVFWGYKGNTGVLYGYKSKSDYLVDFRDQTGIYILYSDYRIIYIGQAGKGDTGLFARLKTHRSSEDLGGRWDRFSLFGLRKVTKKGELAIESNAHHSSKKTVLDHIEAILIHTIEPPLNKQGGKWGTGVQRYLQYRDSDNIGMTVTEMLKEIHQKLMND